MSRDIKILHLETTDVCQAACPLCARETDPEFNKSIKHHLDMDKIMQVFDATQISKLDKMFMCGNYGDPAAGKHTLDIYREFRKLNPDVVLGMNTNGALRTPEWWSELGNILNQPQDYVVFSIDGLEDTNHIYRKNVNWDNLITNVKAFIAAGGSAHWDMLVYQHNEHQVDQCMQLARDLGFKWFRSKVSLRKLTNNLSWPTGWLQSKQNSSTIHCHALEEQSLFIDAQGRVSVCAWLGATQGDTISDIEQVKPTWTSGTPHPICSRMCSVQSSGTNFTNQWKYEIEL